MNGVTPHFPTSSRLLPRCLHPVADASPLPKLQSLNRILERLRDEAQHIGTKRKYNECGDCTGVIVDQKLSRVNIITTNAGSTKEKRNNMYSFKIGSGAMKTYHKSDVPNHVQEPYDEEDLYLLSRKIRTKGSWSPEEDKLLLRLSKLHGARGWVQIAQHLPNKSAKQCRDRWSNQLNPAIVNTPWTKEEDEMLLKANYEMGNRWSAIAKLFPGRTPNAVKNHFHSAMKHARTQEWSKSVVLKI